MSPSNWRSFNRDPRFAKLSAKTWNFTSTVSVGGGTHYIGGFYEFGAAKWVPGGGDILFGAINNPYAAHAFIVLGGNSTDMVVRVSGTSINDAGVRTPADTQDIDTSGRSTNDYLETPKKWIGRVNFHLQSGGGIDCNYGFSKYWDKNNTNFIVTGLEVTGVCGKNDAGVEVKLHHHKATGWTYNAAAPPDPPTPLASMTTDHVTESDLSVDEQFAWKRDNLFQDVEGAGEEGVLFSVTTTTNSSIQSAALSVQIEQ